MSKISLIAIIDAHLGLGYKNQLLCRLPADLSYFKEKTMGKPIIMGRKTFLSIGKPLPGRKNIVISSQKLIIPEVEVRDSIPEALALVNGLPEVMIIGGASLYQQFLPLAHYLYLTRIHHHFKADVFFPEWDEKHWTCKSNRLYPADEKNPYNLSFQEYERKFSLSP